jgi:hypothetical protein
MALLVDGGTERGGGNMDGAPAGSSYCQLEFLWMATALDSVSKVHPLSPPVHRHGIAVRD